MDKVVDSGSTDTGSIPVRDAKSINVSIHRNTGFFHAILNMINIKFGILIII
jgi:hypothetical protein